MASQSTSQSTQSIESATEVAPKLEDACKLLEAVRPTDILSPLEGGMNAWDESSFETFDPTSPLAEKAAVALDEYASRYGAIEAQAEKLAYMKPEAITDGDIKDLINALYPRYSNEQKDEQLKKMLGKYLLASSNPNNQPLWNIVNASSRDQFERIARGKQSEWQEFIRSLHISARSQAGSFRIRHSIYQLARDHKPRILAARDHLKGVESEFECLAYQLGHLMNGFYERINLYDLLYRMNSKTMQEMLPRVMYMKIRDLLVVNLGTLRIEWSHTITRSIKPEMGEVLVRLPKEYRAPENFVYAVAETLPPKIADKLLGYDPIPCWKDIESYSFQLVALYRLVSALLGADSDVEFGVAIGWLALQNLILVGGSIKPYAPMLLERGQVLHRLSVLNHICEDGGARKVLENVEMDTRWREMLIALSEADYVGLPFYARIITQAKAMR